jgi:hypothetical protein
MPEDLTANDIIARVRWLEQDQLLRDMRDRARRRHDLISMYGVSDIPPHMTRGDPVATPSPALIALLNSILADMASYPTTTTVIPEGKTNVEFSENADEVEKAYAIIRARLDEGGQNSQDRRWHQGGTGWVVEILHCAAAGKDVFYDNGTKWRKEVPDPLTCFFPMEGGPCRPSIMGRRYTMQVADVDKRYGKQQRGKFKGQELRLSVDGEWSWGTPIAEDMPVEASDVGSFTAPRIGLPGYSTTVEIMELYTPEKVYHVALHGTITGNGTQAGDGLEGADGQLGQIVYEAETMTDGIPVVIIPGHVTPLRTPSERFQPAILPAMQCVMMIQLIRDMMMTTAFNWKPDFIVLQNPETRQAMKDLNLLREASNFEMEQGGPNLIEVPGERAIIWEAQSPVVLEKMLESWTVELNGYINTATSVTTAEVAKQSTLGGIQLAIGVRKRQQGPWLAHGDWADAEMLKMVRASMKHYNAEVQLWSRGGERWHKGEMKPNAGVTLTPKMVDFPHEIVVSTASMTEEERQMLVEAWAQRRALGLATLPEGLEAAGAQDIEEAVEELAVDLMEAHNTSVWTQVGETALSDYLRTSGGIIVALGQGMGGMALPPGQTEQAPAGPGGQNRIPATASVSGGSNGAQAGP